VRGVEDRLRKNLEPVRPADLPRRRVPSPLHICPHFVRIAARRGDGARNPAEFLDSSICSAKYPERLSSCRKRLRSIPRPRLTLHEVLPLGPGPDGTITMDDEILIRPRRRGWSRPAGQSTFYGHPSGFAGCLAEARKATLIQRDMAVQRTPAQTQSSCRKRVNFNCWARLALDDLVGRPSTLSLDQSLLYPFRRNTSSTICTTDMRAKPA